MNNLEKTLQKFKIKKEHIRSYGEKICKVDFTKFSGATNKGELVLVTSITPTPHGEGKTTTLIGLVDGLNKIGVKALGAIREPSLGPVFGLKGGASGGGKLKVVPQEEIDLHFTGDIHAITASNNLIAAAIDNHLYQGNKLNLDEKRIIFERAIDINDRALREVEIGLSSQKETKRKEHFTITAASEIMAVFCLAKDYSDLRNRIDNIIIGFNKEGEKVLVKELNITGSVMALLKEAFKPNAVLTSNDSLVLIHGGPFANIAHGCNSLVATNLGLKLGDVLVTEAGFGADLGAEKFFDIKTQVGNLSVSLIVVVVTEKALLHHGNGDINKGLLNLKHHLEHLKQYGVKIIIALNRSEEEHKNAEAIIKWSKENNYLISSHTGFKDGVDGMIDLSKLVKENLGEPQKITPLYQKEFSLKEKIEAVVKGCYQANGVVFTPVALKKLELYNNIPGFVCIAKTPLSITDDPKKIYDVKNFTITIKDIKYEGGAEFLVCYTGDIFLMPGLGKNNRYLKIDLKDDEIIGL